MSAVNAFDYSGPSIWTRDAELYRTNLGKMNGQKRREQVRKFEIVGEHVYQSKANKERTRRAKT
jgi:hypothetical protein